MGNINSETLPQNAIDPADYMEVRRRRILAFLIDYIIITLLCAPTAFIIAFAGLFTSGFAWTLFGVLFYLIAATYLGMSIGSDNQATIGMSLFSLRLCRLDGQNIGIWLAILYCIIFWFVHIVFSPLMLIFSLLSNRKRLVQDWLLGTEVIHVYRDKR